MLAIGAWEGNCRDEHQFRNDDHQVIKKSNQVKEKRSSGKNEGHEVKIQRSPGKIKMVVRLVGFSFTFTTIDKSHDSEHHGKLFQPKESL